MRTSPTEAAHPLCRWIAAAFLLLAAVPSRAADAKAEELELTVGSSAVIDFPSDISRISTSHPEVVDTVAVSRREVLLEAKSYGVSTVVIWGKNGERRYYRAAVLHNLDPIRKLLAETFPGEAIEVQGARESLSLTGRVSSAGVAERAAALLAPMAKSVVSNLQVAMGKPETQIVLRVRFAELERSAASALGVNLISTGALNMSGRMTTGQFPSPAPDEIRPSGVQLKGVTGKTPNSAAGQVSNFTLSDALNVFAFRPDLNLGAFVRALQNQGLLQILAEPNLVTTDGKEASFLVGGEFPVPVVQGGASVGAVTVQFREFGIRLSFQPAVTGRNTIKLHVKPEVSSLDFANAVTLSGFAIPALATRRMETHIELSQGQSFVIAGLIDDRVSENLARIPGLARLPVLGALFKTRSDNRSKTELVVMVSPEIAAPLEAAQARQPLPMPKEFLPAVLTAKPQSAGAKETK